MLVQYKGGPELANDDYCMVCLIDGARNVVCADSYRDRRIIMKQVAEDALAVKCSGGMYYVSKAWYDCKLFCCLLSFLQTSSFLC